MPSLKELRNRIASVKATQKITKAMQMVAAAKLRRAQSAADAARPYAERMAVVLDNETVARGLVIRQSPRGGTGIRGDTINITRSLGPNLVTVPNVRSMEVRAAEEVMKRAGFKTEIKASPLRNGETGFVVYTNPRARSQVPKGSTITLFVI